MSVQVRVDPDGLGCLNAGMPILSLDGTLRSRRRLGNILGVHGPHDVKGKLVADGFVRLVDKTVLEYQATRSNLVQFFPNGHLSDYHRAQDHFESCVQSLHRSIAYLERLRGLGYMHTSGLPLVPRPREMEALRDPVKAQVRKFRDFLEHLDDDIIHGRHEARNEDVGPQLGYDRAFLSDAVLQYCDMARWTGQLYGVAGSLSYVSATVTLYAFEHFGHANAIGMQSPPGPGRPFTHYEATMDPGQRNSRDRHSRRE